MDKAEELKQKAKIPNLDRKWGITTPQYLFTEKQLNEFLNEYANGVSRENRRGDMMDAFRAGMKRGAYLCDDKISKYL